MNISIIISLDQYANLNNLPGCINDQLILEELIKESKKFADPLLITGYCDASTLKDKIVKFIDEYKNQRIEEVFFYFSGHGSFDGNEFYYAISDFDHAAKRRTTLENSELDTLIKSLKPNLVVKVIDACYSGLRYVKDDKNLESYMKSTQTAFKNCYFFYSSQDDQPSGQNRLMSYFTQSFAEAVIKSSNENVRYKDIIDHIADEFEAKVQKPFFVTQSNFTESFGSFDLQTKKSLQAFLSKLLAGNVSKTESGKERTLEEKIKAEAEEYCSKEECEDTLKNIFEIVKQYAYPDELIRYYGIENSSINSYSNIPNIDIIGRWFDQNEHRFFAKAKFGKKEINNSNEISEFDAIIFRSMANLRGSEKTIIGVESLVDQPYTHLLIKTLRKYQNLINYGLIILPFISKTKLMIFTKKIIYKDSGWTDFIVDKTDEWIPKDFKLKDSTSIKENLTNVLDEFSNSIISQLKERFKN